MHARTQPLAPWTTLTILVLTTILLGCTPPAPLVVSYDGPVADWPAYGATPGGTKYSAANQITVDNVQFLEQAWEHNSGDIRQAGPTPGGGFINQSSFQVTPIVVDDTLYYCTTFNRVFALDAETGAEKWSFDPQIDKYGDFLPNCRGVSVWRSGASGFCEDRIITGTLDARLIALDAASGKPCSDFGENGEISIVPGLTEHESFEYGITSPPAILNDLIVTGAMVADLQRVGVPSGVVRGYDVRTGELRWAWNPVPPDMEQFEADGSYRSGTANVWSIIAADPERDLVFVPTGNTSPDYFGGLRKGLDFYSSSVVALRGATGEVAWSYQMVHHDLWDYDTPAQPTLMDLEVNGEMVPVVVQVTKMGMTFVLHRDTGEPVYPVVEKPVPQDPVAGEYLSPTQPFPTHFPNLMPPITADDAWGLTFWDEGQCRDTLNEMRNDGIYTPPTIDGSVLYPSNGGGNNWGSPAINPDSQTMYVVTMRAPAYVKLIPRDICEAERRPNQLGTPYCADADFLMSPIGIPCTEPPWATIDAVDLVAGKILWSVPLGTTRDMAPFPFWWLKGVPAIGGPVVTGSGLLFIGAAMEQAFRAFDTATGEELWKVRLPTAANSTPMTYRLRKDSRQFVVVAAGGHWSGGTPAGDHLIAYALPQSNLDSP